MENEKKPVLFILLFAGFILLIFLLMQPLEVGLRWGEISVLFPKGRIGVEQRNLLLIIQGIMLLVVIPVYFLTFAFSWRYRAHSKKARYEPDWDDNRFAEMVWWGLPCLLIIVIGGLTWIRTYELDPYRPIESDKKPLTIQVVALQYKWLFIYPEEKIATVNFFQFPEKVPLHFEITADAPMNSFWIPDLGGQIYAMPKMQTDLFLIADTIGEYRGCSANISGTGFADMVFTAKASSQEDYEKWIQETQASTKSLGHSEYKELVAPSKNPPTFFKLTADTLFNDIIMKYMHPEHPLK